MNTTCLRTDVLPFNRRLSVQELPQLGQHHSRLRIYEIQAYSTFQYTLLNKPIALYYDISNLEDLKTSSR